MTPLRLELHLIPQSSFFRNLRTALGSRWYPLSKQIRIDHNDTCQYCGAKKDVKIGLYIHCHEVWEYNESTGIQKLIGFECLCSECHAVHHWEHSRISNRDLIALLKHACKVNGCSPDEFKKHIQEAEDLWVKRSTINWKIDYGEWSDLIK
jgi:hypothetical protein